MGAGIQLVDATGQLTTPGLLGFSGLRLDEAFTNRTLAPGAGVTTTLQFRATGDAAARVPHKLLFEVRPVKGLPFSRTPSFRVDLTCGVRP